MEFSYVAYTLREGIHTGVVDARMSDEAAGEIRSKGLEVLEVHAIRRLPGLEEMLPSLFSVGSGDLIRLSRNLASILTSGGNLIRALEMLHEESRNRMMRKILASTRKRLDEGASLTEALKDYPLVFNKLFVSVVEVGEYTGRLSPALEQMADILEKEKEAKSKAIRTLMYPVAIIGLSLITLVVLMLVALPPLLDVFEKMGTGIPLMTRIIIAIFSFLAANFLKIGIGLVVTVFALTLLRRIPKFRYLMDLLQAKGPIIGDVTVTGELARFSRTVSMLLEAGVPISTALGLGKAGVNNAVIRRAFEDAEESLLSGHGLTPALKRHPILPSLFVELFMIGEESNTLTKTVGDAANTYQKQQERRLDGLLAMLEPASTVMVGGIVGLIAFSMFVPIYSGLDSFK